MIVIPFSLLPPKILHTFSKKFMRVGQSINRASPSLQLYLDQAGIKVESKAYAAMCFVASSFLFFFFAIFLAIILSKTTNPAWGVLIALFLTLFVFYLQISYPFLLASRRIKKIEVDLLPALRGIMMQLNSGLPLFEAMVILSKQDYGEISREFKKVVEMINGGVPEADALEFMVKKNPSPYFRKTVRQIINGLKEGAPINIVLKNIITNITKEQIIQIERYGSQLSPFAMFYMMGAAILPTLGIIFLVVITSFTGQSELVVKFLFWGLLSFVIFFQFMFSGIIKSKRPNLLGE